MRPDDEILRRPAGPKPKVPVPDCLRAKRIAGYCMEEVRQLPSGRGEAWTDGIVGKAFIVTWVAVCRPLK
jgi:hypothetical protein